LLTTYLVHTLAPDPVLYYDVSVAMYGSFSYHLVTAEIEPKWINANIPSLFSTFQSTVENFSKAKKIIITNTSTVLAVF